MGFFRKCKYIKDEAAIMSWEEIVEYLYENDLEWLNLFHGDIIDVIYSRDKRKRFIVLCSPSGVFKAGLQSIVLDKSPMPDDPCPAHWELEGAWDLHSLYSSGEDALKDIESSPEYKMYFM